MSLVLEAVGVSQGDATILRDVTRLPTGRRNIAEVFQFPVIYDTMSAPPA